MRFITVLLAAGVLCAAARLVYPPAPRGPQVDDYHGTKVADPYRWLEDSDSAQTRAWIAAENKLTFPYLAALPGRARIRAAVDGMYQGVKYPSYQGEGAGIVKRGGRVFYLRQEGRQNQPVLYVRAGAAAARVLLDPNPLSADGTVALIAWQPSPDGKWLAYGLSKAGSDWQEFRVRDVDSGRDLPDLLQWTKFSQPSWLPDSSAFYYSRFPQPGEKAALSAANFDSKLYLHRLRTAQPADRLVYERPDQKEWMFDGKVTSDARYLIIRVSWGTRPENLIYYRDLKNAPDKTVALTPAFKARYEFLTSRGSMLYFRTTDAAPRGRIIAIDIAHPQPSAWKEIVPQREWALDEASVAGNLLVLNYLKDAASLVRVVSLENGAAHDVALPGVGSAALPRSSAELPVYYSFTSFISPPMLYRYDAASGKSQAFEESKPPLDAARYETKQVFYPSKDGTRIPMFLVSRKGLQRNGANPVLLYGYGGFDISSTPAFRPLFGAWLDLGGVLAVANLRGGGEYGEPWHQAGMLLKKQNVFDDFIAAAEWLIANKYTSRRRLAIHGASNGGLLVGACLNQRPDLFGAAIPGVGVMDMLRFSKFTIGAAWASDYGTTDNAAEFKALYAYSPLNNVHRTAYPPTLILTSDHDDRVVPAHSFKYAAAMQAAQQGGAPVLIRIETSAGHGGGKPVSKQVDEYTDTIAFLMKSLGVSVP